MTEVGQREKLNQQQVLEFFQEPLDYRYLGDWKNRGGNAPIEQELLRDWLLKQGYGERIIGKVLRELDQAAALSDSKTLYDANRAVYGGLLRYGVKVKPAVDAETVTVRLVDWAHPENNDFAVAKEVSVAGANTKRPDVVLYVNGLALGVLELKRSSTTPR